MGQCSRQEGVQSKLKMTEEKSPDLYISFSNLLVFDSTTRFSTFPPITDVSEGEERRNGKKHLSNRDVLTSMLSCQCQYLIVLYNSFVYILCCCSLLLSRALNIFVTVFALS